MNTRLNCRHFVMVAILLAAFFAGTHSIQAQQESKPVPLPDGTIQFTSFHNSRWQPIIEEYARQAGLELNIVENPPTGTFQYLGNTKMNYLEALDFLNEMLIPRDRILVRNRDRLSLYDTTKGIPEEIIETVRPEDLDQRGRYELLRCAYKVKGLNAVDLRNEIEPLISDVHRRRMVVLPAANLLYVQETGGNLRFVRSIIEAASSSANNWSARYIRLKHISIDEMLNAAQSALKFDRDSMSTEDGLLTLSSDFVSDRILATGDPQMIARVEQLIATIDIPFDDSDSPKVEKAFYESYRVSGSAELIHDILQSMLSGRPAVILDFDEKTNRVHLTGRPDDHAAALEIINHSEGSSGNFQVVRIRELLAEDVIATIESVFGLSSLDTEEDQPTLSEISQNRIIIRGNPAEVAEIANMMSQIDVPFQRDASNRSPRRFLRLKSNEIDSALGLIENVVPTMGMENTIDVFMPGERHLVRGPEDSGFKVYGTENVEPRERRLRIDPRRKRQIPETRTDDSSGENSDETSGEQPPKAGKEGSSNDTSANFRSPFYRLQDSTFMKSLPVVELEPRKQTIPVSLVSWQQEEKQEKKQENGSGRTSDEQDGSSAVQDESTSVVQEQSVPGAPVTIRITELGIAIESEDLDAADMIEDLIMEELGMKATDDDIALFLLKYRDALEAKSQLERYLGISSSGGSGGGMSGMMGGLVRNALGPAGEMMGGLLGGGAASGGGGIETTGAVGIVADAKNYSLLVTALPEDMAIVRRLVNLIDQPSAIQNPNSVGETYTIPIFYKDPLVIEQQVRDNLGPLLRSNDENARQGGNQQQQMQQQMMRMLMGGRGGGGGGGVEQEAPKAALSVDEVNQLLIVTGPDFIYDRILAFVEMVDMPTQRPPQESIIVPVNNINVNQLARILQAQNPMIEIIDDDAQPGSGGQSSQNRTPGSRTTGSPANLMQNSNFQNMIRQMNRGQGGRGNTQRGTGGGRGSFGGDRGGGRRGGGR